MVTMSKAAAGYKEATTQKKCGNCSMFKRPHGCTLVRGTINPGDTCKYWRPRVSNGKH